MQVSKYFKVVIVILLCQLFLYSGIKGQLNIDSLETVLRSDIPIFEQAQIHNELSHYFHTQDSARSSNHAKSALALGQKTKDNQVIGRAFKNLALVQGYLEYTTQCISYNDSAMYYFELAQDTAAMITILNNVGRKLCFIGRFEEGIWGYQKAESWLKEDDPKIKWFILRTNYAACLQEAQHHKATIQICQEAIQVCQESKNKFFELFFINTLGNAYTGYGDNTTAIQYFDLGLNELYEFRRTQMTEEETWMILEMESDMLNNRAASYLNEKYFEGAYNDLLTSLEILDEHFEGRLFQAEGFCNLGIAAKGLKKYSESLTYFEKAIKELNNSGKVAPFALLYEELADLYTQMMDYENALLYTKKAQVIQDSIFSLEMNKNLQELTTKYQNEKIKQELATTNLAIEKQKNRHDRFKTVSFIIGLLLLSGYWIITNRLKRKQLQTEKRQIELEHGLLRAQMNPHFIFNALNSIQGFFLNNEVANGNEFMGKFSTLMRRILDQSSLSLQPLSEELETLRLYLDIEKSRLEGLMSYEITYEPTFELDMIEIPPLILQPFVENAIWHGIVPKKENGSIKIDLTTIEKEKYLKVLIKDDGVGLQNNNGTHQSKGLKITRERLGKDSEVKVFNNPEGHGVIAELKILIEE